jgi:hypothetical protein
MTTKREREGCSAEVEVLHGRRDRPKSRRVAGNGGAQQRQSHTRTTTSRVNELPTEARGSAKSLDFTLAESRMRRTHPSPTAGGHPVGAAVVSECKGALQDPRPTSVDQSSRSSLTRCAPPSLPRSATCRSAQARPHTRLGHRSSRVLRSRSRRAPATRACHRWNTSRSPPAPAPSRTVSRTLLHLFCRPSLRAG